MRRYGLRLQYFYFSHLVPLFCRLKQTLDIQNVVLYFTSLLSSSHQVFVRLKTYVLISGSLILKPKTFDLETQVKHANANASTRRNTRREAKVHQH